MTRTPRHDAGRRPPVAERGGPAAWFRAGALSLSALVALGLMGACAAETPRGAAPPAGGAPRRVSTAEVRRTIEGETAVPALLQARQRATLSARIPASVIELPWREGESVGLGALVVRLDDAALRSAVAAAEAGVQAAEADQARMSALYQQGAATARETDEATARAAAARAALQAARDSLAYAVLRAPFAGIVTSRPVNVGDVVSPGRPLLEIEGDGSYEVVASLDSDLAAATRVGGPIKVAVDGQATPLTGTVRALSPAGDPSTHRFEVRADLPRTAGLRSGLFARVLLRTAGGDARLTVPGSALFDRGGLTGVFVISEGRARLRWVAAGASQGGDTEVRAGLLAGERVALSPHDLTDGAAVEEIR